MSFPVGKTKKGGGLLAGEALGRDEMRIPQYRHRGRARRQPLLPTPKSNNLVE